MGVHVIKIPDIGEGIAEVELVAWHVHPGDSVVEDQSLADVMTDKATVEIPSPVAGQVLALGGEIGQLMAVGAELIRIEVEGRQVAAPAPPQAPVRSDAVVPVGGVTASSPHVAAPLRDATASPPAPTAQPRASSALPSHATTLTPVTGLAFAAQANGRSNGDKPIASPAVRRRAWELGIDLKSVPASGTAGRIVQADLDAWIASGGATTPPRSALAATSPATGLSLQRDDEEKISVIGLRRKIAQKMQESKRRIPHFTYVEEVDVTELEALRTRLNANAKPDMQRPRLTLLPFLMRALVVALRDFPQINAHFDDEAGVVTRHGAVHIGIATQTGAGLLVPVVRQAQALDLWNSAAELARVADAARNGKATRSDLSGSTITITSLGALGGIVSTPIINHPEVAIIGVNRIATRPMMNGLVVVPRQMMNLSSSFDHRVVDGQQAAEFVQALRGLLEHPAMLFLE